jgi:hypothetical protein
MPKDISEWQEGFWFEVRRRPQAQSTVMATRPTTLTQAKSTLLPNRLSLSRFIPAAVFRSLFNKAFFPITTPNLLHHSGN